MGTNAPNWAALVCVLAVQQIKSKLMCPLLLLVATQDHLTLLGHQHGGVGGLICGGVGGGGNMAASAYTANIAQILGVPLSALTLPPLGATATATNSLGLPCSLGPSPLAPMVRSSAPATCCHASLTFTPNTSVYIQPQHD
jgi:hypothetical protein